MPLPLAALVALSLGALFAQVARAELSQSDLPAYMSRPMRITLGFAFFVYLPALAYFTAFHGDWAYMYFVAWRHVPSALDLVFVVGCVALVPAAFVITAPLARARHQSVVVALMAAPMLIAVLLALVLKRRLGTSANYLQFSIAEGTRPVPASGLGRAVLVALTVSAAGVLWAVRLLRTAPKR